MDDGEDYLYEIEDIEGIEGIDKVIDTEIVYENITKTDEHVEDIQHFMKNYESNKQNYKTTNILSKYERTRVLTERAQQIEGGATPYITNIERFNSSYAIAVEELNMKKIPYIIRRSMPHVGIYEYWKLKDMII
jgi:DNA-directed RNA polymerase subunit K/omega